MYCLHIYYHALLNNPILTYFLSLLPLPTHLFIYLGLRLEPSSSSSSSFSSSSSPRPIMFDIVGNYALSLTWDDGYSADIFPFEILKKIAVDCAK